MKKAIKAILSAITRIEKKHRHEPEEKHVSFVENAPVMFIRPTGTNGELHKGTVLSVETKSTVKIIDKAREKRIVFLWKM